MMGYLEVSNKLTKQKNRKVSELNECIFFLFKRNEHGDERSSKERMW